MATDAPPLGSVADPSKKTSFKVLKPIDGPDTPRYSWIVSKEWLVQTSFPTDIYQQIKIQAVKLNLSVKKAVVQIVVVGLKEMGRRK